MLRFILILSFFIVFPINSIAADQWETEPNNTQGTADLIVATGADYLYGQLMEHDDVDWFAIDTGGASLLTVALTVPNYPSYADEFFYKRVYDANGTMLGQNQTSEELVVFAPGVGTYFVVVDGRYPFEDALYALQVNAENFSNQCPDCGLFTQEDVDNAYDQGYADGVDAVSSGSMYTQTEVDQMINDILTWGDTTGDGKIGLEEAIDALRINTGMQP